MESDRLSLRRLGHFCCGVSLPIEMRLLLQTFQTLIEYNITMTGPGSQPTSLARDGSSPSYPGAGGGFTG
jgi:hypothetical protein